MTKNIQTYIGQRFGRLLVISKETTKIKNKYNTTLYTCKCDCGKETKVRYNNLYNKGTNSCGCLQKELLSKKSRKPLGHASSRAVWNYYKRNAETRNISWEITFEELIALIKQPCYFCNEIGVTHTIGKYKDELRHNGIDRLDNNLGYTISNSVPCCKICNQAKNNRSVIEMKRWGIKFYKHFCMNRNK